MALYDAWYTAIIVLDANVLLSLYRFAPDKSAELLEILKELSSKIWIPHQCYDEYCKHLPEIRGEIGEEYRTARGEFQRFRDKTKNKLFQLNSRNGLMIAQFIPGIDEFFQEIISSLLTHSKEHMSSLFKDDIDDRIARLIDGKIGDSFPQSRLDNIYIEGRFRYDNRIPPGFKDDNRKSEPDCYGDLVAWKQIIEFAYEDKMKRPVIMVTDDSSGEDWFYKSNGELRGPRHELVQELRDQAGVDFYLYTSEQFTWYADKYLRWQRHVAAAGDYFHRLTPTQLPDYGKIAATGKLSAFSAGMGISNEYMHSLNALAGIAAGVSSNGLLDSISTITSFSESYNHTFESLARVATGVRSKGLLDSVSKAASIGRSIREVQDSLAGINALNDRMESLQGPLNSIGVFADSIQPVLGQHRRLLVPFIEPQPALANVVKSVIAPQPALADLVKSSISPKPAFADAMKSIIFPQPALADAMKSVIGEHRISGDVMKPFFEEQQRRSGAFWEEQQRRFDTSMKPFLEEQRCIADNVRNSLSS